ncbi:MAG: oligopeptide transporter substrate-binding protein, partial [Symbiobacteriaceae bacterium]|nr:oligopeptide transporter substrate-binding protein [Symbiobacteriaceae bacterium]
MLRQKGGAGLVWRRLVTVLLALVLVGAAGCAGPKKTEKPVPGGTLTIGLTRGLPESLRPLAGEWRESAAVTQLMYSGLLRLGPKLDLVCDLCETFGASADKRTVTFHLREDVLWHDGQPLTAADVVFTYRAMLEPGYSGTHAAELTALKGVQTLLDERDAIDREVAAGRIDAAKALERKQAAWQKWLAGPGLEAVVATDGHTVSFALEQPYAPILTAMLLPISPAHTQAPVGTGPFKLAEDTKGQFVRMVRHEGYHFGKPWLDGVVLWAVPAGKALEMLRAGALDFVPLGAAEAAQGTQEGAATAGVQVVTWPGAGYQYLGVNQTRAPFSDVKVRQALMYGIDRQGMVEQLLPGRGAVVNAHLQPGHWAAEGVALNGYAHDPARAAELLAEAGWTAVDAQGYRIKDGERLRFTLKVPKGNPVREASAQMVQRDLKVLGVQVDLQVIAFSQVTREVFGEHQADAWLLGWEMGLDPDPGPIFSPDNKWGSGAGWSNARSEELLRQGREALTPAERQPIYAEWLKLSNQELPYL